MRIIRKATARTRLVSLRRSLKRREAQVRTLNKAALTMRRELDDLRRENAEMRRRLRAVNTVSIAALPPLSPIPALPVLSTVLKAVPKVDHVLKAHAFLEMT
jgi:hypothetical protein